MTEHHNHAHAHAGGNSSVIRTAFFLNLGFALLEIVGGLWTNSLAILSDALHDLGDSISLGLSWFLDSYSHKDKDSLFSYGYLRFSLLGALVNTVVLLGGSLVVLTQAIPRLLHPEEVNPQGMAVFAIVGILVNGAAVWQMRKGGGLNVRVAAWHLLEDVLGWAAVLVVSIVLIFVDIPILDPLLSTLITLYVLYNVGVNLKKTLVLFLQGVPEEFNFKMVEDRLIKIDGIMGVHDTHLWSLDGDHHVLTTHVLVAPDTSKDDACRVKDEVRQVVAALNIDHTTIEIDYEDEDCSMHRIREKG